MPIVHVEIVVRSDLESCFDASRDIGLHTKTVWKHTREQAVAGVTSGLIGYGETVTFEATHFGIRQRLTSKIVEFDRPYRFVDEMQKGAFAYLRHAHDFLEHPEGTLMKDTLEFHSPYGIIGKSFNFVVLERYMTRFLADRSRCLKEQMESGLWRRS
ncbi:SRPBCC family protein [Paenibacillus oceani]|uniref:SRPBCC family protein n=1 Tax=Paenibacillus oceani TaxID=2772510 RepID=A0A927C7W3_9BACL|nr:SRPBCC family protein [Paenibacillus oceani]MBD2863024.1 SRPBCC family protein [Paenibacillus oceani]